MNMIRSIVFASAVAGAIGMLGGGSAQALTLGKGLAPGAAVYNQNPMIVKVQRRWRGRGFRGRRGYRGRGFGTGAAIGLGILGLGLAGAAAANSAPYYDGYYDGYRECWWERRPVYNRFGDYVGRRRVRVCN